MMVVLIIVFLRVAEGSYVKTNLVENSDKETVYNWCRIWDAEFGVFKLEKTDRWRLKETFTTYHGFQ
jgi:hypothetical protein